MAISQCPKCGGAQGYSYVVILRSRRSDAWGGVAEFADHEIIRLPKNVVCLDCGKRVPVAVAQGREIANG